MMRKKKGYRRATSTGTMGTGYNSDAVAQHDRTHSRARARVGAQQTTDGGDNNDDDDDDKKNNDNNNDNNESNGGDGGGDEPRTNR